MNHSCTLFLLSLNSTHWQSYKTGSSLQHHSITLQHHISTSLILSVCLLFSKEGTKLIKTNHFYVKSTLLSFFKWKTSFYTEIIRNSQYGKCDLSFFKEEIKHNEHNNTYNFLLKILFTVLI